MRTGHASILAAMAVLFASSSLVNGAIPASAQVEAAATAVNAEINNDPNWIPKLVRLSFHDCVGGCDGCLSFANDNNAGLGPVVALLDGIYDESAFGMSRADFWAVAGTTAVQVASPSVRTTPSISVRFGRTDCAGGSSQYENNGNPNVGKFPDAHGNLEHVMDIFETGFGLSVKEIVALIGGAHSLGQARPENSGFNGPWSPPTNRFDTGFFTNLVNLEYVQVLQVSPFGDRFQWINQLPPAMRGAPPPAPLLMLNADIALYREIMPNAAGLDSACPSSANDCGFAAKTSAFVNEFAASDVAFLGDFGTAFTKMIEFGAAIGQMQEAAEMGTPTPTTQDTITQTPVTRAPIPEAPITQAPITQAPITRAPITQAPITQAPITQAPTAETTPSSGGGAHNLTTPPSTMSHRRPLPPRRAGHRHP